MEPTKTYETEEQIAALREGMKRKYLTYHLKDKDRYPEINYNSSRANYEPLRDTIEFEFFEIRGIDRKKNQLHIPSTSTLASIFSNADYVPSDRILKTCFSYIEDKNPTSETSEQIPIQRKSKFFPVVFISIVSIGLCCLVSILLFLSLGEKNLEQRPKNPSNLILTSPHQKERVYQQVWLTGSVQNAKTIWPVVRGIKGIRYWVQPPITVDKDGKWRGLIYVGSIHKDELGLFYEIKAFVNPSHPIKEGDLLYNWPEAELSSKSLLVQRDTVYY